jgi:formylglycine-generating enzyme required for sulfatase activity
MRKIYFLPLLLLFSFSSKKSEFIPPGTVRITENFFADICEISNLDWLEFEYWTKIKYGYYSSEHLATLPDTLVDRHVLHYSEPYVEYYYRHPAYRNYPVRGISYEQALAFCKWRSERVREWHAIRFKKSIELEYRLPTKDEWEMLSLNGLGMFSLNKKGRYDINCIQPRRDSTVTAKGIIYSQEEESVPVNAYIKNPFGLCNIFGNMSEMVAEKGIAKGGNFKSTLQECASGKDQLYKEPEAWLGFRCVCVIKNKCL